MSDRPIRIVIDELAGPSGIDAGSVAASIEQAVRARLAGAPGPADRSSRSARDAEIAARVADAVHEQMLTGGAS